MKRTALKRRTPLRAEGRSRFPRQRDPKYAAWIRQQPDLITGARNGEQIEDPGIEPCRVEAAHMKSRGAGGDDRANLVPLHWRYHRELHNIGQRTFEARYRISLASEAAELWRVYQNLRGNA